MDGPEPPMTLPTPGAFAVCGSTTYEVPEARGGCKTTASFKVKYSLRRGG